MSQYLTLNFSHFSNDRNLIDCYKKNQSKINFVVYFQGENILSLELDMPNRTTRDYEGPSVAPRVQAAIDAALQVRQTPPYMITNTRLYPSTPTEQ